MKIDSKKYEVRIWYSPEPGDECFVAQVLDMPGVMAHGPTREEAAREIHDALRLALATYVEAGETPPEPRNHTAVALGAQGGMARTKAKRRAAKLNGARGGRPRKARAWCRGPNGISNHALFSIWRNIRSGARASVSWPRSSILRR